MARAGGTAVGLAVAGIFVAVIGWFLFGGLALMFAVVLLGIGLLAVAAETGIGPRATQPTGPVRYACPGCGGDVYTGQAVCRACGRSLLGVQTPGR
jgi:hypothetical protein